MRPPIIDPLTSRLGRDKHECFFLGKCVRTDAKTMAVDGTHQNLLALLRLASGPPLNAANSGDKSSCVHCGSEFVLRLMSDVVVLYHG